MHVEAKSHKVYDHTATWVGQKVTVEVTIHDGMLDLRPNGVGDRQLRHDLWARFGKICCEGNINELDLGGTVEFKFKKCYKIQMVSQQTTLGHLRIQRLSRVLIVVSRALIKPLSSQVLDFCTDIVETTEDVMIIEMTAEETTQALTVGMLRKVPRLWRTPRPKNDKQEMVPIHVSPWNLLRTKLSMEEKGKLSP